MQHRTEHRRGRRSRDDDRSRVPGRRRLAGRRPGPAAVLAGALVTLLAVGATAGAGAGATYRVRWGDTLLAAADRLGVTLAALAAANHITNPDQIYAGEVLMVPVSVAKGHVVLAPPVPEAKTVTAPRGAGWTLVPSSPRPATVAPAAAVAPPPPHAHATAVAAASRPPTPAPAQKRPAFGVSAASAAPGSTTTRPPASAPTPTATPPAVGTARLPAQLLAHPERVALRPDFRTWATAYGVAPSLVESLAWMESGWQRDVISPTGAVGIGQLEPDTSAFVASRLIGATLDPRVPADNIRMTARYLRWLLDQTGGVVPTALAGYYQGLASVRQRGQLADTQRYVADILALQPSFEPG